MDAAALTRPGERDATFAVRRTHLGHVGTPERVGKPGDRLFGAGDCARHYMVYKDRSRYVAYQSMQALSSKLVAWVGGGVLVGLPGRSAASSRQCLSVCSVCRLRAC